jgi:pre-mRNA-processing factor 39
MILTCIFCCLFQAEEAPEEIPMEEEVIEDPPQQQLEQDNGSSNFESSTEKEETYQTDENEHMEFIAGLAESENANSLPSACDENSINFIHNIGNNSTEEQPNEKTEEDTFAQSEDMNMIDPEATSLDAENISEDELPAPTKPEVQDAEEVSDEELPQPKAEMPADTEVVSEDELPIVKKRKHEDETSESDEKKLKTDEEKPKYSLPDLEKYWKAVNADREDFNAWTYLLQYVDSENDVEAAREAYDAFLGRYSYCYGYWRKYADYEKKKGSLELCDQVCEIFILRTHLNLSF